MHVKLIEIRDRATFIPAMAVRLIVEPNAGMDSRDLTRAERERYLLRRAGYSAAQIEEHGIGIPYIVLWSLLGGPAHYDPYSWPRTMRTIHIHLIENWNRIQSGDLLDVEFILSETKKAKISEQVTNEQQ